MRLKCKNCLHLENEFCQCEVICKNNDQFVSADDQPIPYAVNDRFTRILCGDIKDSGNRTEFSTGAVRDLHEGKGRYDLIPWDAIHELAIHCAEGAGVYGERNVERGIPIHSLIDSAIRHLSCYLRGMKDEPHLRAAMWNVAFAIWMEKNRPEQQDIPARSDAK